MKDVQLSVRKMQRLLGQKIQIWELACRKKFEIEGIAQGEEFKWEGNKWNGNSESLFFSLSFIRIHSVGLMALLALWEREFILDDKCIYENYWSNQWTIAELLQYSTEGSDKVCRTQNEGRVSRDLITQCNLQNSIEKVNWCRGS